MKQVDELTLTPPNDWLKDYDTIVKHFNWLDFKDEIGHPLTMSVDFLALVKIASRYIEICKGNAHEIEYFQNIDKDCLTKIYLKNGEFLNRQ